MVSKQKGAKDSGNDWISGTVTKQICIQETLASTCPDGTLCTVDLKKRKEKSAAVSLLQAGSILPDNREITHCHSHSSGLQTESSLKNMRRRHHSANRDLLHHFL